MLTAELEISAGGLSVLVGSLRLRVLRSDELLMLADMLAGKVRIYQVIWHSSLDCEI